VDVLPLAGYTVGVTAARRADELGALLERKGATVYYGPAIRIIPLEDDTELLRATGSLLDGPVDVAVATTGIGFRGWVEAAEGWGLGDELRRTLSGAQVLARGPKAKGAVRAAGLVEHWSPESEASAELLAYLLESGVDGKRIAVQLHGEPLPEFVDTLRGRGADVVEISVYRWTGPADPAPLERLLDSVLAGQVDALSFTSAPAAASVLHAAERGGRLDELLSLLRGQVLVACVGPITAGPLTRKGIPVVQPERARIGALVRELTVALPARASRSAPPSWSCAARPWWSTASCARCRRRRWPCCGPWPPHPAMCCPAARWSGCCAGTPGAPPPSTSTPWRPRSAGCAPALVAAAHDRLVAAGWRPGDTLVLAAAGSSDPRARADVRRAALLLSTRTGAEVHVGYLATGTPRLPDLVAALPGRVAVASWLLAPGLFHRSVQNCGAPVVADPIGPHPRVADLITRRYLETCCYPNAA
jgi:uroporphyrinogen-III synthase